jgi:hypothetical protein
VSAALAKAVLLAAATSSKVAQSRMFNLTGTSIKRWETEKLDIYSGPLDRLLSLGIVRKDQLPMEGKRSISWCKGERPGRGRSRIDETYVSVWVSRNAVNVGFGVPKTVQQQRRRARENEADQYRASLEAKNQQRAIGELASVPRSRDAFLRDQAHTARVMMMVAAKHAAEASAFHGFQIDSESMEEIHERIDAVIEAFLSAQVRFDAKRQAEVISSHQRKIVDASPLMRDRVGRLTKVDPSILRGEAV